jgi:uncharacterized membrane protein YfcA
MNWSLTAAGFGVGIIVGLTGMGGGALMTPVLVIFFGIQPLAAVSSDLVASAIMKPIGSLVHIRHGRVNWRLVRWLCVGSVPAAFSGVLIERAIGGPGLNNVVQIALGVALLLAVAGLIARAFLQMREHAGKRRGDVAASGASDKPLVVRPIPTALLGAVGGLIVGMTSVGSGSLIIVALLMLYPMLKPGNLVGTDLVQAVPLVASAALGHLLFGDFQFSTTTALVVGSVPGVFLGAQVSARVQSGFVRRALAIVLLASSLKLLHASNTQLIWGVAAALVLGPVVWALIRRRNGLPALGRSERGERVGVPDQRSDVADGEPVPTPAA